MEMTFPTHLLPEATISVGRTEGPAVAAYVEQSKSKPRSVSLSQP